MAAQRRDRWSRSTWVLFTEKAVPGPGADQLEIERCEAQNVVMDCANRWLGAMEARNGGDAVAGLAHDIDGYAALVHGAATIQSRRSAREKNYDARAG
jgi:hypothetical protein